VSTADVPPRAGRRLAGYAGILISIATLVAIVWWASKQDPPEFPTSGSDLAALGGAILLYFVACAVRGERWQVLLEKNGATPSRADTYGLIAVGYLGNNVLPARAGDALRVVLLVPRARTDARTVIGTLVAERLCDVLVLGLLFLLLAYGVLSGAGTDLFGDRLGTAAIVAAALLALCVAVAVVLHTRGHLRRALEFLRPLIAATTNLRGRHGAEVLVLTVVVWALEGSVWYLTAVAADLGVDVIEALYLLALSSMLVLIPAGPGYAGTMDAAILIGSQALDKSASAAVTYLILLRFVLMVPITVAGLIIGATRYGGVQRLLRAPS
jgi:glycosyltransferase 2 family protein